MTDRPGPPSDPAGPPPGEATEPFHSPCGMGPDGLPTHSEDGVDLTLIRWMLGLTPAERLEVLQSTIDSIHELRGDAVED